MLGSKATCGWVPACLVFLKVCAHDWRATSFTAAGVAAPVHGVQYSRDGRLLMTCGDDCAIRVWSVADMEVLLTFLGHTSPVVKMSKIGSSEMLATVSETGELAFWDLRLAQDMASTQGHFGTS